MRDAGAEVCPIGYLDDNPALRGTSRLSLPVLGSIADLSSFEHDAIVLGIGDNSTRYRFYAFLSGSSESFVTAIHPKSTIAPDVRIGVGTVICAGAIVNPGVTIGVDAILNTGCTVDHHSHIGDHAHIAPGAHLGGDVTVGEGALVGIGATVMPQRRIGNWSILGAGALLHRDLGAGLTAVGVPARAISRREEP
jgi:sugar O-acyltransferase (sialic acid O-acetyltransferase NeuD family)